MEPQSAEKFGTQDGIGIPDRCDNPPVTRMSGPWPFFHKHLLTLTITVSIEEM